MEYILAIFVITWALFSITFKIVRKLDSSETNNKEKNTNKNVTVKDGMNFYFGTILAKIIIILIIVIIGTIFITFLLK